MSTDLLEGPALARWWNPKAACALTLSLVFLCGAAVGAVVMDFGVHNRMRQPTFGKDAYFEHLRQELNLTPAQAEQVQSVLNDFWQYYRTVLTDSKDRVERLLNDEQRKKFERMLQEYQR